MRDTKDKGFKFYLPDEKKKDEERIGEYVKSKKTYLLKECRMFHINKVIRQLSFNEIQFLQQVVSLIKNYQYRIMLIYIVRLRFMESMIKYLCSLRIWREEICYITLMKKYKALPLL